MNEIFLLALGAIFSAIGALISGAVMYGLRSLRDRFDRTDLRLDRIESKADQHAQNIARVEGALSHHLRRNE